MDFGTVYLVGAGPGDAGLITVRGAELLKGARCVLYDALVNPRLLELAPDDAARVLVGKRGGAASPKQDEINEIILENAKIHERVVRLKGGDPFVFGRGGEEALFLSSHGVPFEVVPGVTAGIAAGAYSGIPATHRGLATTLALATGREDPTKEETQTDWGALAKAVGALAVYMGVGDLERIVGEILAGGRPAETPAALIENATLPAQRTIVGTLGTIAGLAREKEIKAPAIFLLGETISLRERLRWYEMRPLFGRRIVTTRPRERAGRLRGKLEALGAEVLEMPVISIEPLEDYGRLDEAIADLGKYDWVAFTSPAGVEQFLVRLCAKGLDARAFAGARIAAIGPATAEALACAGLSSDFVPTCFTSEALVGELGAREDLAGKRFLLPRADIATDTLSTGLTSAGARVDEVVCYRTVGKDDACAEIIGALSGGGVDAVTFTSASTVDNFMRKLKRASARPAPGVRMISIGPVTSARMRELGLTVAAEAQPHDLDGLVAAVSIALEEGKSPSCNSR